MTKHLFLTGTKGIGKSTLLRECLYPHRHLVGGYYIQRINDPYTNAFAFRIQDISSSPFYLLHVSEAISSYSDIIALFSPDEKRSLDVFPASLDKKGADILESAWTKKKLILMDELGRFELQAPRFMETVFAILKSPLPVIGILKKESNPFLDQIKDLYADVILDLDTSTPAFCKSSLTAFLKSQPLL